MNNPQDAVNPHKSFLYAEQGPDLGNSIHQLSN